MNDNSDLRELLVQEMTVWLSNKLQSPVEDISPDVAFVDYGLDSIATAQMLNVLEYYTKCSLESHLTKDYTTIFELADYLVNMVISKHPQKENASKRSYGKYLTNHKSEDIAEIVLPEI